MFKLKTALLAVVIVLGVFTSSQSAILGESKMQEFGDFVSHAGKITEGVLGDYSNLIVNYHYDNDDTNAFKLLNLLESSLLTQTMIVQPNPGQKDGVSKSLSLVRAATDDLRAKKEDEFMKKLVEAGEIFGKAAPNLKLRIEWTY